MSCSSSTLAKFVTDQSDGTATTLLLTLTKAIRFVQYLIIIVYAETTVYSDRLSLHYPPISDAFDNIDNFFCIKQMIQL